MKTLNVISILHKKTPHTNHNLKPTLQIKRKRNPWSVILHIKNTSTEIYITYKKSNTNVTVYATHIKETRKIYALQFSFVSFQILKCICQKGIRNNYFIIN